MHSRFKRAKLSCNAKRQLYIARNLGNQNNISAAFNSPAIEKQLVELKNRKEKNAFLESIMTHPSAVVLNETNGHKTILFAGNKGPKTITWKQTKQVACELNRQGYDVAFLPELSSKSCADSLVKKGKIYRIVDFKYCITKKANTLVLDLEHGFQQANTIVLKLERMDSGTLKDAINYLTRNDMALGNIILINSYGQCLDFSRKALKTGIYSKAIKGFL